MFTVCSDIEKWNKVTFDISSASNLKDICLNGMEKLCDWYLDLETEIIFIGAFI